uniref:Uncharacterized protein n=1 Tax=Rhizophora mucronata TaxID=61149 RepID=A0A2P2PBS3_RHIMU
MQSWIIVVAG